MNEARGRALDAGVFSLGMVIFALCAHREALLAGRVAGLLVAGAALARGVARHPRRRELFALTGFPSYRLLYIPLVVGLGVAMAMYYRSVQHRALLPERLAPFFLTSAAIGICEEAAYRGFVQGCLRRYGAVLSCAGAAVAHTAYKCGLFALPDVSARAHLLYLGVATLIVGLVLALMREAFGSLLFPVLAHAAFDVAAYGDYRAAPWWV